MVRRAALDRQRNDVPCALVGFFLGMLFDIADHQSDVVLGVLLRTGEHHGLRLVERDARNAFEFFFLFLVQGVDLFLDLVELLRALVQLLLTVLDAFQLLIERFLALEQPALGALQLCSAFSVFLLGIVAKLVNLFLCLQHLFFSDLLGLLLRIVV